MKRTLAFVGIVAVVVFCLGATPADTATSSFNWHDIVKGLVSGVIAAAIGFAKSENEKLDFAKFAKTVIFGGIVGVISAWKGTSMDEAEKWASMTGVSIVFTSVWDALVRRVATPGIAKVMARAQAKMLQAGK